MNNRQLDNRGKKAERLLKNPLLTGAFNEIRESLHRKWEETEFKDSEARETIFTQLKCLAEVERYLIMAVKHGKIASKKIEEINNGHA